jgi:ABC-2 type transport system ATP-binding protein
MISVESLTKRFADAEAVSRVSFRVEKGEILGFLGPNGAGKTTTMRMLTCYVPPTAGTAKIGGYDIYDRPVEVRRQVGYLPESVPLYGEMRVQEYLRFRARLKGVARSQVGARLDYVMGRCGIGDVRGRIIDHLSKGYRQRVGLAEALLHNPPILILDEPTVGLDPKQIRQVRELIRDLGREHTIILSSHILPEVEQVCGRVVIIDRGKLVAQGSPEELRREIGGKARLDVEIRGARPEVLAALESLPGAGSVRETPGPSPGGVAEAAGDGIKATIETEAGADLRGEVFRLAVERGWTLLGLTRRTQSLEDVFIDLTTTEADAETAAALSATEADRGRADGGMPASPSDTPRTATGRGNDPGEEAR